MPQKPKTKPLANDSDFEERSKTLNFNIKRIFRYFMLSSLIVIIGALVIIFCKELIINEHYRNGVLNEIKDNITGIVITGLAVIGINLDILRRD